MMSYSDQIREFVPDTYKVLGTDGFGRSDSREKLRHFFEVDAKFIVSGNADRAPCARLDRGETNHCLYEERGHRPE